MNADAIARYYQALEYIRFGRALEHARYSMLAHFAGRTRALVLGDGDARFLQALVEQQPTAKIDAVDLSAKMLELARKRIRNHSAAVNVRFHQADVRTMRLPGSGYDLIATHFFFDVFTAHELELWIRRVARASADHALWVVSDFDLPHTGWRRHYAAAWIQLMYKAFRIATGLVTQKLPDWRPILRDNGFQPLHTRQFRHGFIVSELWHRTLNRRTT
jgi:ubiquinone/menaquinone biosynthesis C-methylase UbiE